MEAKNKTIFITSFFGLIGRNILATNFLKILRNQPDLRIVIFVPEKKKDQYDKYFGGGNVVVEGVKELPESRLERIFAVLFHNLSDTAAWRIHRLISRKRDRCYFLTPVYWVLSKAGYLKIIRRLVRRLDYRFSPKNRYRLFFEKYRPAAVFATDIFHLSDIGVMREAKERGVRIIGMVRSWDNITSKGLNRIVPDKLIVNTESIKAEAIKHNDIEEKNIFVVGVPHYDDYLSGIRSSRQSVLQKLGLDINKKTIFFAPPADMYSENNPVSMQVIKELSRLADSQILIRLYIVDSVNLGGLQPVPNKIAIDDPGTSGDFTSADLTAGDSHLADLLYHSDVVVAFASTLAVDAVVFNKPVVFIGFDGDERPYWKSLRRFYDYDHQREILKTGGIKIAKNIGALSDFVSHYLKNPYLDEAGRRKIIDQRCWKLDGKSGERLARVVLTQINDLRCR